MATFDSLTNEILKTIDEYSEQVKVRLEERLDETANQILDYIIKNAPRSGKSKPLADSFSTLVNGKGINKVITIYSKDKGRIVHLLEFGFKHVSGKFVMARPFPRPSFDLFTPKMLEDIKDIISKGESIH